MSNREIVEKIVNEELDEMMSPREYALTRRKLIDRITSALDEAVAQTWEKAREWIRSQWLAAYPLTMFPEPPPPPAECSRDLIAGAMGRHMATRLIEEFTDLEAARKGEKE